jgi:hypothetical protein
MRIPDELLEILADKYLESFYTVKKTIPFYKYLQLNESLIKKYKRMQNSNKNFN